jgi:DNA ligase-1
LDFVANGIAGLNVSDIVFDGELCLIDENGNEDFQGVMKELRKKNHRIEKPLYKIFDVISLEDFHKKKSAIKLSDRLECLNKIMEKNTDPHLSVLDQERVKDDDHFVCWTGKANENNWEGVMLRLDSSYKGKRTKDLLKYKNFHDDEYEVLDLEFGPFRYVKDGAEHEEEMLSCVYIQHKGNTVRVGSGFTIEQRQNFYKDPKLIKNKIIQVQYFEETKNQDGGISLRFPTFKYLYGNARDA